MTREEASDILELSPHASPAERSVQYDTLRRQLEDKLAKAPTPGLRDKYRTNLKQLEDAFAVLAQTDDSAALPVAQKSQASALAAGGGAISPAASTPSGLRSQVSGYSPAKRAKSGGKEFLLVAVIAVVVLAAGGWFVLKTRADNAEKARIAAEQKAASERQAEEARVAAEAKKKAEEEEKVKAAAAAKAEQERREKLLVSLRTQLAEIRARWEIFERMERDAERSLSDTKSELRGLRDASSGRQAELTVTVQACEDFHRWLSDLLLRHPARLLRSKAEELVSSRAPDDAAPVVAELRTRVDSLEEVIRQESGQHLATTGRLSVASEPAGLQWTMLDAFGRTHAGFTPAEISEVAAGRAEVRFARPGWPDQVRSVVVGRNAVAQVSADFTFGQVVITSAPSGAEVLADGKVVGKTPLIIPTALPGDISFELRRKNYVSQTVHGQLMARQELRLNVNLEKEPHIYIEELDLELRHIKPGTFAMGQPSGGMNWDRPVTQVTLTKQFWLGKTEVTQAQWEKVMGSSVEQFHQRQLEANAKSPRFIRDLIHLAGTGPDHPMYYVSWNDAIEFCRKLTELESAAGRLPAGYAYSLPTEAQWEYACRAGTTGKFAGNLSEMAVYSAEGVSPVGLKKSNTWGLYDMHGNVEEWCLDWLGAYPGGSSSDPVGAVGTAAYSTPGTGVGIRGGHWIWIGTEDIYGSAYRCRGHPDRIDRVLGFRVALVPVR